MTDRTERDCFVVSHPASHRSGKAFSDMMGLYAVAVVANVAGGLSHSRQMLRVSQWSLGAAPLAHLAGFQGVHRPLFAQDFGGLRVARDQPGLSLEAGAFHLATRKKSAEAIKNTPLRI